MLPVATKGAGERPSFRNNRVLRCHAVSPSEREVGLLVMRLYERQLFTVEVLADYLRNTCRWAE